MRCYGSTADRLYLRLVDRTGAGRLSEEAWERLVQPRFRHAGANVHVADKKNALCLGHNPSTKRARAPRPKPKLHSVDEEDGLAQNDGGVAAARAHTVSSEAGRRECRAQGVLPAAMQVWRHSCSGRP
ncbi:hypothetical protein MRX96_030725 [Rhipicephalus microplus]